MKQDMDDDEAIIAIVDSNLQRETILPSEWTWAYKIKQDAVKHQAPRKAFQGALQNTPPGKREGQATERGQPDLAFCISVTGTVQKHCLPRQYSLNRSKREVLLRLPQKAAGKDARRLTIPQQPSSCGQTAWQPVKSLFAAPLSAPAR